MLPTCECKRACFEIFTEERRKEIFAYFQSLKFGERRLFLDKHITPKEIKTKTVGSYKRNRSINYFLSEKSLGVSSLQPVCKIMFLHTIGKKTDAIITEFIKSKLSFGNVATKDNRGLIAGKKKHEAKLQLDKEIISHIELFHPVSSHYKLTNAPFRRYLPSDLTIRSMYQDFLSKGHKITYDKYRQVFASQNIGFSTPSQDECPTCSKYTQHKTLISSTANSRELSEICQRQELQIPTVTYESSTFHNKESCADCLIFEEHRKRYILARKTYEQDKTSEWPNHSKVYTVDMQKVLIVPKMKIKDSFFVSRLIVMNETFAPLHFDKNKCVLWHEGINGRSAPQVASTYYKIISTSKPEITCFTFWADNCSAQNKNWTLYTALTIFVNSEWGPEKIIMKYFEPGHSFMKADAVHGKIGKEWMRRGEILKMEDVKDVILKAERKNEVTEMRATDFLTFEDGSRKRKKSDEGLNIIPLLENVRYCEFQKGSRSLFYKEEMSSSNLAFLKKSFKLELPKFQDKTKGINTEKKRKIINELLEHMPPRKKIFWNELPTNDDARDMAKFAEQ